ncbi:MAG: 4-(cytidine 5'-diphospho)-2-C-methyl-D-erythritol kinase [Breznakia sp.]
MKLQAMAKINLALDVVQRRLDGYHELDMIMAPISLYDEITITLHESDVFTCSDPTLKMDAHNTVCKAVDICRERYSLREHFAIHVEKKIPMQAGLAGGSADAAAVIKGINQLCNLNLNLEELIQIAVQVGADVPFCLVQKVARVKGIGEKIEVLSLQKQYYALLVKPVGGVSTKACFEGIDFTSCTHPPLDKIASCIMKQEYFTNLLDNTLEQSAFKLNKDIKNIKDILEGFDFEKVLMSGSGSSVFGLTTSATYAKKIHYKLKNQFSFIEVVKIL